jgi:hypothetical protein
MAVNEVGRSARDRSQAVIAHFKLIEERHRQLQERVENILQKIELRQQHIEEFLLMIRQRRSPKL